MRKITINERPGSPRYAFLDMSGRYKPKVWGGTFRMGDRAAAYLWVAEWRKRCPNDRILVIDDPFKGDAPDALNLDAFWLFKDVADEIWLTEHKNEHVAHPGAYPLYHTNLWRIWLWLRTHRTVEPTLEPKPDSMDRARQLLKLHNVPEKYVTLQPLFDAPYNTSRNAPVEWWREVANHLKSKYPVVLLGTIASAKAFGSMGTVHHLWSEKLSPMDSLALIKLGAAHVGGETGTTLWAPMFKRPTTAVYHYWSPSKGHFPMDCRPMSFGAPVEWARLNGSAADVTKKVQQVLGC